MFSEISKNWAGQPLSDYETVVNYIDTTRTKTGLAVDAHLVPTDYPTRVKVSDKEMKERPIPPPPRHPAQSQPHDQSQVTWLSKVGSCSCVRSNLQTQMPPRAYPRYDSAIYRPGSSSSEGRYEAATHSGNQESSRHVCSVQRNPSHQRS